MDISRGYSLQMCVLSVFSALGSLSVSCAIVFIKELRRKSSYQAINYFALSTAVLSFSTIVGAPQNKSGACWFEAIVSNIFGLSSYFWNVVVFYLLYCVVVHSKIYQINVWTHVVCWGLPVIVTLFPLTQTTYGTDDYVPQWCFVVESDRTVLPKPYWITTFWVWMSYYSWVWFVFIVDFTMLFLIILKSYRSNYQAETISNIHNITSKLVWYPLIIVFADGLSTFSDTEATIAPADFQPFDNFTKFRSIASNVLPCTQGILTALVFWSTMPKARIITYKFVRAGFYAIYRSIYKQCCVRQVVPEPPEVINAQMLQMFNLPGNVPHNTTASPKHFTDHLSIPMYHFAHFSQVPVYEEDKFSNIIEAQEIGNFF